MSKSLAGKLPELSSRHFTLNQEDEFLPFSHPSALSILGKKDVLNRNVILSPCTEPWKVFLDEYNVGKKTSQKRKRNNDMV